MHLGAQLRAHLLRLSRISSYEHCCLRPQCPLGPGTICSVEAGTSKQLDAIQEFQWPVGNGSRFDHE